MKTEPAPEVPRINDLLVHVETGGPILPWVRPTLANLYGEELAVGDSPFVPFAALPREFATLATDLMGLPTGATLLTIGLPAPRPLLTLDQCVRMTVIAEAGRMDRVLGALLKTAVVLDGAVTRYMTAETFDYVIAGLMPGETLVAEGHHYDHAAAGGSIPAGVASAELAVKAVKPGGYIGLVGTRQGFRETGGLTLRWWVGTRAREIGTVFLPPDSTGNRLQLTILEKRREATPIDPLRFVLPVWRTPGVLAAWRRHLERRRVDTAGYAYTRQWARTPVQLKPVGPAF